MSNSGLKYQKNFSLTLVEEEGLYFSFILNCSDNFIANMIRRIIMLEVPTVAVEEVSFVNNDTIHIDDIIANRLRLVPLVSGKVVKKINFEDEILFTLEGSYEKGLKVITSADMQIKNINVYPVLISFVFEGETYEEPTPIVTFGKTHKLKLFGKIRKGNGKMHAKWNPVCTIVYKKVENGYLFNVETTGVLKGQEIIDFADEIIKDKIKKGILNQPKPK